MASINDVVASANVFGALNLQMNSRSMSSSTANANELTPYGGASIVIATNAGATPGSLTTRTPAEMIADGALYVGQTWILILCNFQATGTLTLAAGAGAAVGGTATVAVNTCRVFTARVASTTSIVFTGLAIGFTGNV